jgi:hypothetical protein
MKADHHVGLNRITAMKGLRFQLCLADLTLESTDFNLQLQMHEEQDAISE